MIFIKHFQSHTRRTLHVILPLSKINPFSSKPYSKMPLVDPVTNSAAGGDDKTQVWMSKLAGKKIGDTSDETVCWSFNSLTFTMRVLCPTNISFPNRHSQSKIFLKSTESSSLARWLPRISRRTGQHSQPVLPSPECSSLTRHADSTSIWMKMELFPMSTTSRKMEERPEVNDLGRSFSSVSSFKDDLTNFNELLWEYVNMLYNATFDYDTCLTCVLDVWITSCCDRLIIVGIM